MESFRIKIWAIAFLAGVTPAIPVSSQNLIQNGDFEQGPAQMFQWGVNLSAGDAGLPGWTIVAGDVDAVYSNFWNPYSGAVSIDLNGFVPGTIAQSFPTIPGGRYALTFALAGNPYSLPTLKHLLVSVGNQSSAFVFDNTGTDATNMGWQRPAIEFIADATMTTLMFQSLTMEPCGSSVRLHSTCLASMCRRCCSKAHPSGSIRAGGISLPSRT